MKTHHISLLTKDAAQNIHFYTQVLGLRLVKNSVNQENIHIRHLFYGDYLGTPGTVVTFFVVPLLGRRTDGNHYIDGINLSIPTGSLAYWQDRLTDYGVAVTATDHRLAFNDPEQVPIQLIEMGQPHTDMQLVPDNGIQPDYQITRFAGTTLAVPDVDQTAAFFEDLLHLTVTDHSVQLDDGEAIRLVATTDFEQVTRFGRGSIDHVALAVDSLAQLFDFYKAAEDQGREIEMYRDRGWFKSLYIREPGDNRIELATTTPGFSLDEPILTMGHTLGLTPKFEGQRQTILDYYAKQGVNFHDVAE